MSATLAAAWLLPPLAPLLLIFAGLFAIKSNARAGHLMIAAGALILLALSIPLVGSSLVATLEEPFADPTRESADAIVILGGGSYPAAPEYGRDTVNGSTLERLRYGAFLFAKTSKPILVTGGDPHGFALSEAAQMRAVLQDEWHVPVKWSDERSNNTFDNARNSYSILNAAGIQRIYLVTHAWHMERARRAFANAGFAVVPAPTRYATHHHLQFEDFVPSAEGLQLSAHFCREALGAVWYRLRTAIDQGSS